MVRRRQQNTSQKRASTGNIRIISGLWRGRKLPVHDAEGLRPTTDRVKETVFNWLAQDIAHARCLDLFSGSGGLGFESASRQAKHVTMVELNKSAFQQLEANKNALKAEHIEIIHSDALTILQSAPAEPYDIVFIDPPFRKGLLEECVNLLEKYNWLAANAMIYIETEKELLMPTLPADWHLHREKIAGQVRFQLFEKESS
jgi:16S rRNA (guanine966-N2)-methyltransferase